MAGFASSRVPEVLIVDDERETCEEIAEFLDAYGFSSCIAGSVDEALASIDGHCDVRVVLTDLRMPRRSGFDLLQALSAQPDACRVIIMTGHADEAGKERALQLGAWAFVAKPLDPHAVLDLVRSALADTTRARAPDDGGRGGSGRGDGGEAS